MPREPFCFSHYSGVFSLCMVDSYTATGCFLFLHQFPGTLSLCQAGIYLSRLISRAFFFSPDTFSPAMARRYTIRPPHSTLRCTGNSGHYHLFFFLSSHLMIYFPEGCRGDIPQTRVTTLTIVENLNVFPYY